MWLRSKAGGGEAARGPGWASQKVAISSLLLAQRVWTKRTRQADFFPVLAVPRPAPWPPSHPPLIHGPPGSAWLEEVSGLCLDLDNSCLGGAQSWEEKVPEWCLMGGGGGFYWPPSLHPSIHLLQDHGNPIHPTLRDHRGRRGHSQSSPHF